MKQLAPEKMHACNRFRRWALLWTGPLAVLPQGVVVFLLFGTYDSPEIGHLQKVPLFLQGNTDLFGSCLFAATMAAYVVFGFTASVYLTLRLQEKPPAERFLWNLARSLGYLKFHGLGFLLFGLQPIATFDSLIRPNDFRNMFILAALLYVASGVLITCLYHFQVRPPLRLALAPLLMVTWLIIGSDGTTAKAGQILYAGEDPQIVARGRRHAVMLAWHQLCDDILGDVGG